MVLKLFETTHPLLPWMPNHKLPPSRMLCFGNLVEVRPHLALRKAARSCAYTPAPKSIERTIMVEAALLCENTHRVAEIYNNVVVSYSYAHWETVVFYSNKYIFVIFVHVYRKCISKVFFDKTVMHTSFTRGLTFVLSEFVTTTQLCDEVVTHIILIRCGHYTYKIYHIISNPIRNNYATIPHISTSSYQGNWNPQLLVDSCLLCSKHICKKR